MKSAVFLLILGMALAQAAPPPPTVRTTANPKLPFTNVLVLRGGTIFDPRQGRMLPDQTVIIRGERIEKVGPRQGQARIPRGASVLDLRGKFIIPGLIDAHVHLVHQLDDAHLSFPRTRLRTSGISGGSRKSSEAESFVNPRGC